MRHKFSLVCLLLFAAACTTSDSAKSGDTSAVASDDAAGRTTIEGIRGTWKDAADRKDSTAIAAFYANDAVLATSGAPVANGTAEIEKALGRMVNLTKVTGIDSKSLVVMGDEAYDYGTFTQEATGPDGKVVTSTGYFLVTLHRQTDGSWKITRHLSTIPPVAP